MSPSPSDSGRSKTSNDLKQNKGDWLDDWLSPKAEAVRLSLMQPMSLEEARAQVVRLKAASTAVRKPALSTTAGEPPTL